MGVIINTDTKVTDLQGAGLHGFTNGDPPSGVAATQLSDEWCNNVQQEINDVIIYGSEQTPNTANPSQLFQGIQRWLADVRPRTITQTFFKFRTQRDATISATEQEWGEYRRTEGRLEGDAGVTYDLCSFVGVVDSGSPPDVQVNIEWRCTLVQTDDMTNYANVTVNCSARRVANSWTVQSSNADVLNDNPAGATVSAIASGTGLFLRVALPALPAAKKYNIFVKGTANVVTI